MNRKENIIQITINDKLHRIYNILFIQNIEKNGYKWKLTLWLVINIK